MDIDELDDWLGTDRSTSDPAGQSDGEAWDQPAGRRQDLVGQPGAPARGRRWIAIAGAAALVWVTVMVLAVGGRSPDGEAESAGLNPGTDPTVLDPLTGEAAAVGGSAPAASAGPPGQAGSGTVDTDGPGGAAGSSAGGSVSNDVADGPAGSGGAALSAPDGMTDGAPADSASVPVQAAAGSLTEAGAILALRQALQSTTDGLQRYLEWALPIQRVPIAPDIDVVVLDALWLQGRDGVYDRAERGRWAVPVTLEGAVMAAPWAIGGHPPDPPPEPAVPLLRQRPDEVEEALLHVGWSAVVVHASEPHPDLVGTWLALVDGIDPAGVTRAGSVVWLDDDVPMAVLGARS